MTKQLRILHDNMIAIEKGIKKKGYRMLACFEPAEFLNLATYALIKNRAEICVLETARDGNHGIERKYLENFLEENRDYIKKSASNFAEKRESIQFLNNIHQNCFRGYDN